MTGAIALSILAFIAMTLSLIVAILYRGQYVPVWWPVFLMMSVGSLGIFSFYIGRVIDISTGNEHLTDFVFLSRILWGFVLTSTSLFALSVLVAKRPRNNVQ